MPHIVSEYWSTSGGTAHTKVQMIGRFGINDSKLFHCPVFACQFHHLNGVEATDKELDGRILWCSGNERGFEDKNA